MIQICKAVNEIMNISNSASVPSNNNDSPKPKTPGGISKSLLTPCRRVGLSRNWKKGGVSPFISPLSSNKKIEDRKGASDTPEDNSKNIHCNSSIDTSNKTDTSVTKPLRKRSRTLLTALNENNDQSATSAAPCLENEQQVENIISTPKEKRENEEQQETNQNDVSTPVSHLSKGKRKSFKYKTNQKDQQQDENVTLESPNELKLSRTKSMNESKEKIKNKTGNDNIESKCKMQVSNENCAENQSKKISSHLESTPQFEFNSCSGRPIINGSCNINTSDIKEKKKISSPNDLSKECIVVLQNNLFKGLHKNETIAQTTKTSKNDKKTSQTLFDSDDEPLINLNKEKHLLDNYDDVDFIERKPKLPKLCEEIKDTQNTSSGSQKTKNKTPNMTSKINSQIKDLSDDDEDFDLGSKKTIIIRKTYDKVMKPSKAKSTGSITQKDIDDLKLRIESKKKQLLAKSMTEDTKELRDLIKRWQKGCQDALLELMNLIKMKCPDKSNMDYTEILKALKIPVNLVGYDAENDCFVTPDDESIIMASINNY